MGVGAKGQRKCSEEVACDGRRRAQGLRIPLVRGKGTREVGSAQRPKTSAGLGTKLVLDAFSVGGRESGSSTCCGFNGNEHW